MDYNEQGPTVTGGIHHIKLPVSDVRDPLGEPHGGLVTGHQGGAVLVGLHDPDGIEIRLYADRRRPHPRRAR